MPRIMLYTYIKSSLYPGGVGRTTFELQNSGFVVTAAFQKITVGIVCNSRVGVIKIQDWINTIKKNMRVNKSRVNRLAINEALKLQNFGVGMH